MGARFESEIRDSARVAVIPLLVLQAIVLFIIGTAQVAGGMVAERDEDVIDYQRLIPMSPVAKVLGYVFGLPIREYVIFLATLPFTAWAFWKGQVGWETWLPLYTVVLSSSLVYHFTGLVTGMVVKNRRWAFLVCIVVVFSLYTVIPQMANFGLVFFKYLTIMPVVSEVLPGLLPETTSAIAKAAQRIIPTAKFFNLDLREVVFTLFSQGGLILTFAVMLCRKWKRAESHLLGKLWAAGFFIWVQLLLLGNALPMIEPGTLFPSRGFSRMTGNFIPADPSRWEAVAMAGIYGCVTLALIIVLGGMVTPTLDNQLRGWRRAKKQGASSLPPLSDSSTSFWIVLVMALAGAFGWYCFVRGLVESRWFPGHVVPQSTFGFFAGLLLICGLGFQALLESKGGRTLGIVAVIVGVVPVMVGFVVGAMSDRYAPVSAWIVSVSPFSQPFYAASTLLSISEIPAEISRAIPRSFYFFLFTGGLVTSWLIANLRKVRADVAKKVLAPRSE